ncbi:cytochrome c-type biogenesis protein CcmH [Endozoicomonas sp. G2_1]|nr:cytochrome c-type biogenesis protein [Endozoicomonas sp. G2_1]MBO9489519.1 cytochrome c-type biogenesis protein CcmH [Endozoicomonas sp. G2_1]
MTFSVDASPVDTYQFDNEVLKTRYQALVKELRCPKCQNQNLADSNSQIAIDLRREVYNMLHEGKADKEIVDFMVARYGDFVLYRPKLSKVTYVLWFAPAVLFLLGIIIVIVMVRKRAGNANKAELSADENQRLAAILEQVNDETVQQSVPATQVSPEINKELNKGSE